jgi:probable F420-dependent oxidoreductase
MPGLDRPGARWRDELRRIEDLGFHAAAVSDHFTHGWAMDPIVAMTVAAEATTRLHVTGMVFCNDFRHPVLLHKAIANLDVFSGGRVEFGIGAGWRSDDHDAAGLPFDSPGVRIDRLAEAVDVITELFGVRPVTYLGKHYQVTELVGLPAPVQRPHPPLLIGGGGRRVLELAGRSADIAGINPVLTQAADPLAAVADLTPQRVAQRVSWARAAAIEAGRDPDGLEYQTRILDLRVRVGATEHRCVSSHAQHASPEQLATSLAVLHGCVDECVDSLVELRERFGISYVHLGSNLEAAAPLVARLA